jgi:hypothetical protein
MMTPLPARSANTPDLHRSSPLENTRDTAYDEDANTGYAGNGPQVMATLRNLAISLLYLAGSRRSPAPSRPSHATETAYSTTSRYEAQVSNDFGDPVAAPPAPLVDSVRPE